MIRILLPAAIVAILAIGGGGLFFLWNHLGLTDKVLASEAGSEARETLAELDDATRLNLEEPEKTNAFGAALRMVVEGRTGAVTTKPDIDLRGHLPADPPGWASKRYELAEGEAMVGRTIKRSMVVQDTNNEVLRKFERASDAGKAGETRTYLRGDLRMLVRMQVLEQLNTNTVQGGLMADISAQLEMATAWDNNGGSARTKGLFAKFNGIEVVEQPRWNEHLSRGIKEPVDYRRFIAELGPYIEIEVVTNAADAHVAALFQQIDMDALHAMLPAPLVEYRGDVGWQTASAEPLSNEPPGPSLARRAHDVLNNGFIYSEEDTEILADIVSGKIETWEDVIREHSIAYEPSDVMKEILGPAPETVKIAQDAQRLYREFEKDSGHSSYADQLLLQGIYRMNSVTQADVIRSRAWRGTHHPDVLAIVQRLPRGDITFEQAMQYPAPKPTISGEQVPMTSEDGAERPTVRRGLDSRGASGLNNGCKIEHGVRRCVLSEDGS